jgi:hypothetical protein
MVVCGGSSGSSSSGGSGAILFLIVVIILLLIAHTLLVGIVLPYANNISVFALTHVCKWGLLISLYKLGT